MPAATTTMCGIAGFTGNLGAGTAPVLVDMIGALAHRGPDDEGLHVAPGIALGMRRLSIVDPAGGRQPIYSEDGSVVVVANGEVYNHRRLRAGLEGRGHRFSTGSDMEVVAHLYEEEGPGLLGRLVGMFALAIWDARRRRLVLARDRLGIKPLCYAELGGELAFASELGGLEAHPCFERELDRVSLVRYFALDYIPAPHTIWRGARKLPAGHLLVREAGRTRIERWWAPPGPGTVPRREEPEAVLAEELGALLDEAVALERQADVPVGAFLSGGIDSSAVVAALARQGGAPETYSIGFAEGSYDESAEARRVALHLGVPHRSWRLDPADALEAVPRLAEVLDEPMADASIVPTGLLCRHARSRVKVALSGDGGDELFAGYPTFRAHRLARLWRLLPRPMDGLARALQRALPVSHEDMSLDFKLDRFLRGVRLGIAERHFTWMGTWRAASDGPLFAEGVVPPVDGLDEVRRAAAAAPFGDEVEQAMDLTLRFYLQDDILMKMDRASMACGLEVRVPLLDHRLVEFAGSLPLSMRLRGRTTKVLLRRAMAGVLPRETLARPKKGFGMPVAGWLAGPLRPLVEEVLGPARLARQGLFDVRTVRRRVEDHMARRRNERKLLWALLVFQLWHARHLEGRGPATSPVPSGVLARVCP